MKSSKYISILCVGSLLSLASCTDGFESDNKINGSFAVSYTHLTLPTIA